MGVEIDSDRLSSCFYGDGDFLINVLLGCLGDHLNYLVGWKGNYWFSLKANILANKNIHWDFPEMKKEITKPAYRK